MYFWKHGKHGNLAEIATMQNKPKQKLLNKMYASIKEAFAHKE